MNTKDINLRYIIQNYIELEDLAEQTKFSTDEIKQMITQNIVPDYSYKVLKTIDISSPLNDVYQVKREEKYFPKATLKLLLKLKNTPLSPKQVKHNFKGNLLKAILKKQDFYPQLFDTNKQLIKKNFETLAEEKWHYYINGVYGICTYNVDEEAIINKNIAVQELKIFNESFFNNDKLTAEQEQQLKKLNEDYNAVATIFAPYQRENSTRGLYLDRILKEKGLQNEIKSYE
ncbi:DUF6058 family natural product biosynthesis protein [Riemerella columbina]|uniref:DUF6058 family natural product biosynthesis protein n=1 Tax=Riemerella columbina TaxID=103810 RepID=UPI00035CD2E7|nr:DUF6058 family natural product biosynthesis protein [Riemerella columbina]